MKRTFDKTDKSSELYTCTYLLNKFESLESWHIIIKIDDTCICPNYNQEIMLENFTRMRWYL